MSKHKVYLNAPEGIRVQRHTVGETIRFTIPAVSERGISFRKLVAIAYGSRFSWIHPSFSA
jgi:hypothetical protein